MDGSNPEFKIYSLTELCINIEDSLIAFAEINSEIKIAFDFSKLNEANQWDIVNLNNKYLITKTISSFWSNKIWKWIDQQDKIWFIENKTF